MKQIHVKLPPSLHKQLKVQSAVDGTTIQNYVVRAIDEKLATEISNSNLKSNETTEEK
jgi:predicted HicB family RNase H-like nuclease